MQFKPYRRSVSMFDGIGIVANRKPEYHLATHTVFEAAGRCIHPTLDLGGSGQPHGQATKCTRYGASVGSASIPSACSSPRDPQIRSASV